MIYYKKILPWENKRRLEKLIEFRLEAINYFNNSHADWMVDDRIEELEATQARAKINRMLDEAHDIMLASGTNPVLVVSPPPAIGGYIQNVDLVHNIFILHNFHITPQHLLDFIERAIGIYERNERSAYIRAFNPLFYLGIMIDWLAGLPFFLIGRAGFNRQIAESSLIGRVIKGIIQLIIALASLLAILHYLDQLQPVKQFMKDLRY